MNRYRLDRGRKRFVISREEIIQFINKVQLNVIPYTGRIYYFYIHWGDKLIGRTVQLFIDLLLKAVVYFSAAYWIQIN